MSAFFHFSLHLKTKVTLSCNNNFVCQWKNLNPCVLKYIRHISFVILYRICLDHTGNDLAFLPLPLNFLRNKIVAYVSLVKPGTNNHERNNTLRLNRVGIKY